MLLKRENHNLLLQKQFMPLIQSNLPVFSIPTHGKIIKWTKRKYVQVLNGFHEKREKRALLFQKQFRPLIQRNPKTRTRILYFTNL